MTVNFKLEVKFETKFSLSEEQDGRELFFQGILEDVCYMLSSVVDA